LQPIDGVWTIVGGFDGPEGPFPDLGLDTRFRWIVGQPATLLLFSAVGGPRTVALVVRSMVRHQRLQISIDGGSPHRRRLRGIFPRAETLTVTHEFTRGPCRVEIGIDRWTETVEGRRLGAVLDSVEFAPGPPRRGFWALGFVRAT
jgi:hypothetical protein